MADENRTPAAVGAYRVADLAEHPLQCIALRQRRAQRVVRVDPGDRERRRIEARAGERLHVEVVSGAALQCAVAVDVDEHGRDLQQCIGRGLKAAGFHIDRDRQVTAEAP